MRQLRRLNSVEKNDVRSLVKKISDFIGIQALDRLRKCDKIPSTRLGLL